MQTKVARSASLTTAVSNNSDYILLSYDIALEMVSSTLIYASINGNYILLLQVIALK